MKANRNIGRFLETLDNLDKKGKNVPGLIMSRPGFGKTSSIQKWCEFKGYKLVTLVPSTCAADDIVGLQSMVDGRLVRLTPSWFDDLLKISENGKNRTVLFIDELSACDSYLQAPLFNLIFNHDLGEKKLPNNVFIVAAGNYSDDLNNSFRMTAPLVNRFVILNLSNDDYDIQELLDGTFESISTKDEIENFFGLTYENSYYDFNLFKNWVSTSKEVQFGKNEYVEDPEFGLLGFTSIRSLSFGLQFAEAYMGNYSDNLWIQVLGDTLGTSNKREGKLMRMVIESFSDLFVNTNENQDSKVTLSSICDDIIMNGVNDKYLNTLEKVISRTSIDNISSSDLRKFTNVVKSNMGNKKIQKINQILTSKMESSF